MFLLSFDSDIELIFFFSAGRKDDIHNPSGEQKAGFYDGFSETQTESQVQLILNCIALSKAECLSDAYQVLIIIFCYLYINIRI